MRTLGFSASLLVSAGLLLSVGCASVPAPPPLTGADIVALTREGKSAPQIIAELKRTDTVLPLQASDIVALHEAGVAKEVLDHLQRAQIEDIRWRDRHSLFYRYPPGFHPGFVNCPWPPAMRSNRGPWYC